MDTTFFPSAGSLSSLYQTLVPVQVFSVTKEPTISHLSPGVAMVTAIQVVSGCIIKDIEFRTREVMLLPSGLCWNIHQVYRV